MKWLYISFATLGALIAIVFAFQRTWAYFHRVAVAISHADVELNVLIVVGLAAGILAVPVGAGLGLVAAALLNLGLEQFRKRRLPDSSSQNYGEAEGGLSWVTRRGQRQPRRNQNTGE